MKPAVTGDERLVPELPELPGVRHRFLDLPGVRVHLAEAGPEDAAPVLCLHGWPQHWWMWRRVIGLLGDEHRLVLPDMRGLGWSSWPADGDFAKERLVDDALALLDDLGLARADVLAHDWGAWTGILLALRSPERVRSLLALGIVHPWQPRPVMARNAWRFAYQLPIAAPVAGELLIRGGQLTRAIMRGGWGDHDTWDEAAAALFVASLREPGPACASSRLYRTFLARELPAIAAGAFAGRRLAVPTRLVIGRRDPLGSELARGLERHGDDAASEVLDGCGHFLPEERPAEVAERARALFA